MIYSTKSFCCPFEVFQIYQLSFSTCSSRMNCFCCTELGAARGPILSDHSHSYVMLVLCRFQCVYYYCSSFPPFQVRKKSSPCRCFLLNGYNISTDCVIPPYVADERIFEYNIMLFTTGYIPVHFDVPPLFSLYTKKTKVFVVFDM